MDRFRIVALEKLISSNSLEKDQLEMTAETLMRKISIIVAEQKEIKSASVRPYNEKEFWLDKLQK